MSTPVVAPELLLEPAAEPDAEAIAALLAPHVASGLVLPRSSDEIRRGITDFVVATTGGSPVGCVSLRDYGDGLQEIRSLVVLDTSTGRGVGSRLVAAVVALAMQRRARRVFALTLRPHLFLRQGFTVVSPSEFPQKIWMDCWRCPKWDRCDEIALVLDLPDQRTGDTDSGAT
jgi:amino-acid N-acetyltransferase